MEKLANRTCIPCRAGVPPMRSDQIEVLLKEVAGWNVVQEHHLRKEYKFKNFIESLEFANRVGEVAEEQGHHPDICIAWGRAEVIIWTHAINGLSESDFILAAKIDQLQQNAG